MRDALLSSAAGSPSSRRSARRWRGRARGWRCSIRVDGLDASDTHRSVYLPVVRDQVLESLALFDFADPSLVTGERATTSGPAQALYFMNSPFVIRQAEALADRVRGRRGRRRPSDRSGVSDRPRAAADRRRAGPRPRLPPRVRGTRGEGRPATRGLDGVLPGSLRQRRVPLSGLSDRERTDCLEDRSDECPRALASRPVEGRLLRVRLPRVRRPVVDGGRRRGSKDSPLAPKAPHFPARAKRVIFLCMNGAPSHVDTFDYKPELASADGKPSARPGRHPRRQADGLALEVPASTARAGCGSPSCSPRSPRTPTSSA